MIRDPDTDSRAHSEQRRDRFQTEGKGETMYRCVDA